MSDYKPLIKHLHSVLDDHGNFQRAESISAMDIIDICQYQIVDLQSQLAALREENASLRDALIGLVGSSDSKELLEMKKALDLMPVPNDERLKTVAAIDALLGKECAK